jgi:hypothetical protein
MEHAEDFDNIIAHAVGDRVRGIGDNQLASALEAPGAAQAKEKVSGAFFAVGATGATLVLRRQRDEVMRFRCVL